MGLAGQPVGPDNSVWMEQNQGTPCCSLLPLPPTSFPATNLKTIFFAHLSLGPVNTLYFFWLCWIFAAAGRLSLVASRDSSSLRWLLLVWSTRSRACGLQWFLLWGSRHGLIGCGTWTWLLQGMWNLPRPGIECMSPALAGRFFTTEPPGKAPNTNFWA